MNLKMSCRALAAASVLAALPAVAATAPAIDHTPEPYVRIAHPEWTRDASIYQINTRQFSAEGTFRAAQAQLPRLRALGVDILWLMPVHPIGAENRKGTLGSPYAVQDYFAVNPEFGTVEDLRAFVDAAHAQGMHVILDWVANHTAWDNALRTQHPDWYKRDWKGDFRPTPWWDWTDIIELDYRQPALREYMAKALRYWVEDVGVDGYRADVAGFVPLDFWEDVRAELDTVKPVFMLGEWESRDLHAAAFDATYAWSWWDAMHKIAKGQADANALHGYYSWNENFYPKDALRMVFTSNHDKNSWEGTDAEIFGDAFPAALVLSVVGEGMPMFYNGQEAGLDRRLEFFEKDPIDWKEHPNAALIRELLALKSATPALANGPWGATMVHVPSDAPGKVLSFVRQDDRSKVFAVFNLTPEARTATFHDGPHAGGYREFRGGDITVAEDTAIALGPWQYRIFVRRE